jgi:hypothetical protein
MRPTSIIAASKKGLLQPSRGYTRIQKAFHTIASSVEDGQILKLEGRSEISGERVLRFEELHFTKANRALPKRRVAHGTALLQNGC